MSKTRGNVVDPLEIIEKHGTDALRFTLAIMAAPGTDIALSEDRILSYRAFANKIWNAARFLFMNLEKFEAAGGAKLEELAAPQIRAKAPYGAIRELSLVDRWIFSRLAQVTSEVNDALREFRFHEAAHQIYHFFWGDFCDWYIEWLKPLLAGGASREERDAAVAAWRNLFAVFESALRLLHPFMPFLTEELWHRLPQAAEARSIALATFPAPPDTWRNLEAERQMALLQEIITAARTLRAELKVDSKRKIAADFSASDDRTAALVESHLDPIRRLAALSALSIAKGHLDASSGVVRSTAQFDLRIAYGEAVDGGAEVARLRKEKERLQKDVESKKTRLADPAFRSRAPEHVIQSLETTLRERQLEYDKLVQRLAQLEKT
jgi:valyl-tRNA synthetase